jgi:hypothetical protein
VDSPPKLEGHGEELAGEEANRHERAQKVTKRKESDRTPGTIDAALLI